MKSEQSPVSEPPTTREHQEENNDSEIRKPISERLADLFKGSEYSDKGNERDFAINYEACFDFKGNLESLNWDDERPRDEELLRSAQSTLTKIKFDPTAKYGGCQRFVLDYENSTPSTYKLDFISRKVKDDLKGIEGGWRNKEKQLCFEADVAFIIDDKTKTEVESRFKTAGNHLWLLNDEIETYAQIIYDHGEEYLYLTKYGKTDVLKREYEYCYDLEMGTRASDNRKIRTETGEFKMSQAEANGWIEGLGSLQRARISSPPISDLMKKIGRVVVKTCVNRKGKVVYAEYDSENSTIKDDGHQQRAIEFVSKIIFERNDNSPDRECGRLTFRMTRNGYTQE